MKYTIATVLAAMVTAVSAQGVTISLPSGVSIPSGITLPSGVAVVTAGSTSTTTAEANANNVLNNKRFHRRQAGGGGVAGISAITGISGLSINLAQTRTAAAQATGQANANAAQ